MKGDQCGFLHQFDVDKMPICRNMLKFGECKELDCPFKHTTGAWLSVFQKAPSTKRAIDQSMVEGVVVWLEATVNGTCVAVCSMLEQCSYKGSFSAILCDV